VAIVASIFVHPDVESVRRLHSGLYAEGAASMPIRTWVERQTRALLDAHARRDPACTVQIRAVIPGAAEASVTQILAAPLSYRRALRAVAMDHGFAGPDDALACQRTQDPAFERALERIERADVHGLRRLVAEVPSLVHDRSRFGHGATLLHHLTANGVEVRRQVVPSNAPRLAMVLIEAGADAGATMHAYGGEWTVRDLLDTSAHPATAGVVRDFHHVLNVAGA
jgi:hypothetical protein